LPRAWRSWRDCVHHGRTRSRAHRADLTIDATAATVAALGGKGIAVQVDHSRDDEIKALFERVEAEQAGSTFSSTTSSRF
jgi:NAD(P)-dependent dehydrogenase (short-subunit alcohol dehydrogenase family)